MIPLENNIIPDYVNSDRKVIFLSEDCIYRGKLLKDYTDEEIASFFGHETIYLTQTVVVRKIDAKALNGNDFHAGDATGSLD